MVWLQYSMVASLGSPVPHLPCGSKPAWRSLTVIPPQAWDLWAVPRIHRQAAYLSLWLAASSRPKLPLVWRPRPWSWMECPGRPAGWFGRLLPPRPNPWQSPTCRSAPTHPEWAPWLTAAGPSLRGSTWLSALRRRVPRSVALGGVGSVLSGHSLRLLKAKAMRLRLLTNLRAWETSFSHLAAAPAAGRPRRDGADGAHNQQHRQPRSTPAPTPTKTAAKSSHPRMASSPVPPSVPSTASCALMQFPPLQRQKQEGPWAKMAYGHWQVPPSTQELSPLLPQQASLFYHINWTHRVWNSNVW